MAANLSMPSSLQVPAEVVRKWQEIVDSRCRNHERSFRHGDAGRGTKHQSLSIKQLRR